VNSNQVILYDANPKPGSSGTALDQVEITKSQTTGIVELNETEVETEQFLITVEGPWVGAQNTNVQKTSNYKVINSKTIFKPRNRLIGSVKVNGLQGLSAGMQNVLNRKFRKPSAYKPPPAHEKKRKTLDRPPPLQPGELEKRYYGSSSSTEFGHQIEQMFGGQSAPHENSHQFQQYQKNNHVQKDALRHQQSWPDIPINNCNNVQRSASNFKDAPEYNDESFYGEEEEGDNDSFDNDDEFSHGKMANPSLSKQDEHHNRPPHHREKRYSNELYTSNSSGHLENQYLDPNIAQFEQNLSNFTKATFPPSTLQNKRTKLGKYSQQRYDASVLKQQHSNSLASNQDQSNEPNRDKPTLSRSDLLAMFGAKPDASSNTENAQTEPSNMENILNLNGNQHNTFMHAHKATSEKHLNLNNSQNKDDSEMLNCSFEKSPTLRNRQKQFDNAESLDPSSAVEFHLSSSGESSSDGSTSSGDESSEEE